MPSPEDLEKIKKMGQKAASYVAPAAPIVEEKKELPAQQTEEKPKNNDMLNEALITLAPILLGGAIGGAQGGAIGAQAGLKGQQTLRDQEKIAREEGKQMAELEAKKLEALGKEKKEKGDRSLAFSKEYMDNPVTKITAVAHSGIQGMREATKNPNAYDDVALVYGFMKALDPGSVVREGEFATAQKNTPLLESFGIKKEQLTSGRFALTPEIRQRILEAGEKQYLAKIKSQEPIDKFYKEKSSKYEIDPEEVVQPWFGSQVPQAQAMKKPEQKEPGVMAKLFGAKQAVAAEVDPQISNYAKQHGLNYEKAKEILIKRGYGQE